MGYIHKDNRKHFSDNLSNSMGCGQVFRACKSHLLPQMQGHSKAPLLISGSQH